MPRIRKIVPILPAHTAEGPPPDTPRKMLREKEVLAIVPVTRRTLQNWVIEGKFPKPYKIGQQRIAWYADEIAAWQKTRPQVV